MGKSTAAAILKRQRLPVFDSDREVHNLLTHNKLLRQHLATYFPEAINQETGALDRQKLGKIVFVSPSQRHFLESLIHPFIWQAQNRFVHKARRTGQRTIVLDIPLLFETRREQVFDAILCVSAPPFLQRQRALLRIGMNAEKLAAILRGQWPSREKEMKADYVIKTGIGFAQTARSLNKTLNNLTRKGIRHAA